MLYSFCRGIIDIINFLWFRIKPIGLENLPKDGGYVLCSNHISFYDPLLLASLVKKRQVHYLAKYELFKNSVLRWLLHTLGMIPVNRKNVSIDTLKQCLRVLNEGKILGIFPEGTRVKDRTQSKPLDGYVYFANKTKTPIVPVHIIGNMRFREKVVVVFGEPIYLDDFYGKKLKPEEISKISEKIMDNIYNLK